MEGIENNRQIQHVECLSGTWPGNLKITQKTRAWQTGGVEKMNNESFHLSVKHAAASPETWEQMASPFSLWYFTLWKGFCESGVSARRPGSDGKPHWEELSVEFRNGEGGELGVVNWGKDCVKPGRTWCKWRRNMKSSEHPQVRVDASCTASSRQSP